MPAILEAVKAYATVGEICDVFSHGVGRISGAGNFLAPMVSSADHFPVFFRQLC